MANVCHITLVRRAILAIRSERGFEIDEETGVLVVHAKLIGGVWRTMRCGDIDELSVLCPGLLELPVKEAFMKLFLTVVLVYMVLPFGWSGSPDSGLSGTSCTLTVS